MGGDAVIDRETIVEAIACIQRRLNWYRTRRITAPVATMRADLQLRILLRDLDP